MISGSPLPSAYSLQDKRIIVTGASRGLGRAIACELARAGARLLLVARDRQSLEETVSLLAGPPARMVAADLSATGVASRIIREARSAWERLDGLVNNAGIQGPIGPFEDNDPESWEAVFRVNLFAPADLCRHAARWMKEGPGGSIVNLSGGGATSPRPRFSAYGVAKSALVRLSETLAAEWAPHRIRVNAIAPGAMNTHMLDEVLEAGEDLAGAEYHHAVKQKSAGGTDPATAARLCAFLLSDEAASITGRLLSAVWDRWADLPRHAEELAGTDIYTLRRIVPEDRRRDWSS